MKNNKYHTDNIYNTDSTNNTDNIDKYTLKKITMGKTDIYVISTERCKALLNALDSNSALMHTINLTPNKHNFLRACTEISQKITTVKLYPALSHNRILKSDKLSWMPMLCLKTGESFYPVKYTQNWICRDCMGGNGETLIPLIDVESEYFIGTNYDSIRKNEPPIFHNITCKCCGHMLQGKLLKL